MKCYEVVIIIYYYCLQHIQIIPKYHYTCTCNKEQVYKTLQVLYCKTCKLNMMWLCLVISIANLFATVRKLLTQTQKNVSETQIGIIIYYWLYFKHWVLFHCYNNIKEKSSVLPIGCVIKIITILAIYYIYKLKLYLQRG